MNDADSKKIAAVKEELRITGLTNLQLKAELSACKERVRELEETLFKIKRDSLEPDKIYIHLSRALGPALAVQEQSKEVGG